MVSEVRRFIPTVIVVDDGSKDETAIQAKYAGALVLNHKLPAGKGASLCTGWLKARSMGFDWVLCLDGDGQHSPADIPNFLECATRTGASLVVGNRMVEASTIPWLRRQVNRWMSRQLSRLSGQHLPDTQNGFRLIDLHCLDWRETQATHFEIESDILISFLLAGYRVEFVPVQVIYKSEQSKIHPWRDTIRWFKWWHRRKDDFESLNATLDLSTAHASTSLPNH